MPAELPPQTPENRTFICTVVFVDLVDYSRQGVTQQGMLKKHLNEMIGRSLANVGESDRLAIDTGDGAALCFFGDPEDALFAAANLREAVATDPGPAGGQVRIGINLGPARIVRDLNGNRNIIGDGINVAQRVMGFAAPNQILVSRSFYEVVSHISQEHARLFQYAGLHRDKHVREHEVYEFQVVAGPAAPPSSDIIVTGHEPAAPAGGPEPGPFSPELLARVTGALVDHLGPMARLLVRRAALRARDSRQLLAAVTDSLSEAVRQKFLADVGDLAASRATPPATGTGVPPSPPSGPERRSKSGPVTAKALAVAEDRLARHLGPIARVLVAQAARETIDTGRLAERLASHIADPVARRAFLAAMEEGGS
jgi:class 3 adenylate cyclase